MAAVQAVTEQENLGSTAQDCAFSIRRAKVEDADALGVICFNAFKAFNDSVGIDYKMDFHSIEFATGYMRHIIEVSGKGLYDVVAVREGTGQPLASGFLHHSDSEVYSVGPISVDPHNFNQGVGKAIMINLIDRAKQEGASSVRLTQAIGSFLDLVIPYDITVWDATVIIVGWDLNRDCFASFWGTVEPRQAAAAASAVGLAPNPDAVVRLMEQADVAACAQFFKDTNGYNREAGILQGLGPLAWVSTSKCGEILAYTTAMELFGHTVARNEEDFIALFCGVVSTVQMKFLLHISTARYPKLAQWALAAKLRLMKHSWYMTMDDYQAPRDGRVYFPNVLH